MAQYSRTVLTDAGVILARRMMDETITMEFTRIVTGDGQYSSGEDLAARTALKSPKQSFPLSSRSLTDEDRVLHLKYVISNVNPDSSPLTVGYYVREVGIYAHVTGESEILYAVAIADADAADYLPEYDELQPSTITMDWFITVGNTENITIQASPSAYALAEDLEELAEVVDQKLDADGDSAGNTVAFTSSDAADSTVTKSTGWETVAPLASGETHESFMTKFSKMIKNLRWIYKLLGTTDISSIGNGTVTGGLSSLNDSLANYFYGNVSLSTEHYEFTAGQTARLRFRGADIQETTITARYYLIFLKWNSGDRSLLVNIRMNQTEFSCDTVYNTTGLRIGVTNARYLVATADVSGNGRGLVIRYN